MYPYQERMAQSTKETPQGQKSATIIGQMVLACELDEDKWSAHRSSSCIRVKIKSHAKVTPTDRT